MSEAKKDISALFESGVEIDKAIKKGVREAVLRHKKAGNPIVAWKDGKIVWIQPEDIQVDEEKEVDSI